MRGVVPVVGTVRELLYRRRDNWISALTYTSGG
jgi:hypothetical protein